MIRFILIVLVLVAFVGSANAQSKYQVRIPEKTVTLAPGVFIQQNGWRLDFIGYHPDNTDVQQLGTHPSLVVFFQGTYTQGDSTFAVPNVGRTLTITDAATLGAMATARAKSDSTEVLDGVIDAVWRKAAPVLGVPDNCITWGQKVVFP